MKATGTVEIEEEICKGCTLCVEACPEAVLGMTSDVNSKGWLVVGLVAPGCTGCSICAFACPDGVFTVFRAERASE